MPIPIEPRALREALQDGEEIALLDVRERGSYARGHLFLAVNLPLSHIELRIRQFVPRLAARIVLCDAGEGLAARAAQVLEAHTYTDVRVLSGGVGACGEAGFELFRGHYATTYAFGLYVGRHYATPEISPQALKERVDAGEALVMVDTRPMVEFSVASIPGALDLPLSELVHRIRSAVPDERTPVVVNCGAVTRGVLGAQSLIEAELANPVVVLRDGVRGWDVSGFELAHGASGEAPQASAAAKRWAVAASQRILARTPVRFIDREELARWRQESERRTLYLVDVRSAPEYEAGHLEGAISILGGELVGLYEDHLATLNARVCLVDDDAARAIVTASWLERMGWPEVAVLSGGIAGHSLVSGRAEAPVPALERVEAPALTPSSLKARIDGGSAVVVDFAESPSYEHAHIPGAWWMIRASLPGLAVKLPAADAYVATSEDGRLAALAAADLSALTDTPVLRLEGGTAAWREAGLALVPGLTRTLGEIDDVPAEFVRRPGDDRVTALAAQRRMLEWQNDLLPRLERDQSFSFPPLPA